MSFSDVLVTLDSGDGAGRMDKEKSHTLKAQNINTVF